MSSARVRSCFLLSCAAVGLWSGFAFVSPARGQNQTFDIGLTALQARDPTLTGSGVGVTQVEAPLTQGSLNFEATPTSTGQPVSLFTYYSANSTSGASAAPPNDAGSESSHADAVGSVFYGSSGGVAPGVGHVNNVEANFFYKAIQTTTNSLGTPIVNQSFVFTNSTGGNPTAAQQQQTDQIYDNFAAVRGTLFVSAVGNGGSDFPAGTAYNGIGVGDYSGSYSVGPTADNARSKPDIVGTSTETSFSTPQVAGAAAILYQAGARGDGGTSSANIAAATNSLTIKALLLNGATKPSDWTHTSTQPLDPHYGAGVLNVNASDLQLNAGQHAAGVTTAAMPAAGKAAQLAPAGTYNVEPMQGFSLATLTNPAGMDVADHYFLSLSAATSSAFTLTSTLTWNRQNMQANINDLDLYLLNPSTGAQYAASISTVDNVEHLYVTNLLPGNYDLEVVKNLAGNVSLGETYALAFSVVPEPSTGLLVVIGGGAGLLVVGASRRRKIVSRDLAAACPDKLCHSEGRESASAVEG